MLGRLLCLLGHHDPRIRAVVTNHGVAIYRLTCRRCGRWAA